MDLIVKRPYGTRDMVPAQAYKWHTVEKIAMETAEQYGFKEIRFPTFEETKLFKRSVGDATDVVQKEMYGVFAQSTENGRDEDGFTLRPEGTAGTVRAVLENGLLNEAMPQKVYYIISCFRHERPQAGRLREFHQFGAEMFGSASPAADAELIAMAKGFMDRLGISGVELFINSIGCPVCRKEYHAALKAYFENKKDELCDTCKGRLDKNPMRILDCKSPICSAIAKDAPVILDFLCDECREHFEKLKENLSVMGIEYSVNPKIVRGLDYYTKTVFEFVASDIGAQSTICGGGRYDGLVEQLGGPKTPALGFAMGLERLIMTMENQGCDFIAEKKCDLYIASMGEEGAKKALSLAKELREEGYWVEYDLMGRGLKAQMKYADKIGAAFSMVIGDNEIENNGANLKNMRTGEQIRLSFDEGFVENFSNIAVGEMFSDTMNNI